VPQINTPASSFKTKQKAQMPSTTQPSVIKVTVRDQDGKVLYRQMIPAQIPPGQSTIELDIRDKNGRLLASSSSDSGKAIAAARLPATAKTPKAL
jgi:hypothetical protein